MALWSEYTGVLNLDGGLSIPENLMKRLESLSVNKLIGLYDESSHVLKLYVPDDHQKMVDNCEVDKLTGVFVTDD